MSNDGRSLAFPGVLAIQSDTRPGQESADTLLVAVSAIGADRHLAISGFWEDPYGGPTRQKGGLKRDHEGNVESDVPVPRGASMFIANMGTPPLSEVPTLLWAGWIRDRTVAAISPRRTGPMLFSLAEDEQVVAPPLAMGDRTMHLYTVRGAGTASRALWRHAFHDGKDGPERVVSEALGPLEGDPLFPVATPRVGEYGVRAILGWLESGPSGVVAVLALVDGGAVTFVRSEPTSNLIPFQRQRLGLWKGGNAIELAGVLQERGAAPKYSRLVFYYSPDEEPPRRTVSTTPYDFPAGQLRACATDYAKQPTSRVERVALATDAGGNLVTFDAVPDDRQRQTLDRGLPADYPLPFVVSKAFYIADFTADGKVTLWHFTEAR